MRMCDFAIVVVAADTADAVPRSQYLPFDHIVGWAVLDCPEELLDSCIDSRHTWHHRRK